MLLFRIASRKFPIFDGTGALLHGGRWNSPGHPVIYCAESLAVCQLEALVHIGRAPPPRDHGFVEMSVPDDLAVTTAERMDLPVGWDNPSSQDVAQTMGDAWIAAGMTAILRVPSVAAPNDCVVVVNPRHPDFIRMTADAVRPMLWDPRLFAHPRMRS